MTALLSISTDGPDGHGQTVYMWNITRAQYDELMAGLRKTIGEPDAEASTDDAGMRESYELTKRIAVFA